MYWESLYVPLRFAYGKPVSNLRQLLLVQNDRVEILVVPRILVASSYRVLTKDRLGIH
jgi:hypothetical protein